MTNELNTQWHPAFYSAMRLELKEDAEYLDFHKEYNLNTKPLEMDLLVIKKLKDIEIKNEIGKIFRWLKETGYSISQKYAGIYYVSKEHSFPIQILVSKELSKENQKWLTLLSDKLNLEDAKRVIAQLNTLTEASDKVFADSVLQVALSENENLFNQLRKEDGKMCEALRKLFEPELNEALERERQAANQIIEQATLRAEQATLQAEQATLQAEQAKQATKKNMLLNALKLGSSAKDISYIMGIPFAEVEIIEKELLQLA